MTSSLVVDRILSAKEINMLKSEGYVYMIDVGDNKLNVLSFDKDDRKHNSMYGWSWVNRYFCYDAPNDSKA